MKKNILASAVFLVMNIITYGQTVVYDIFAANLINLNGTTCANARHNNSCTSDWGFSWTSTSGVTPVSITLEVNHGISGCGSLSTTRAMTFNGAADGTITSTSTNCSCSGPVNVSSNVLTPANYAVGSTNIIMVSSSGGCEGLRENPSWSGAYARVTVVYSSCTDPDVPTPTASINNICPNSMVTLDWTGDTLNNATDWHIYTTSCGTGQIAQQTGTSLIVNPTVTTTYYIRGEDGAGCVDESIGACGSITVTVDQTESSITSAIASTNNVCPATSVNLTANGVSAGTGATLTWFDDAGGAGTNLGGANPIAVSPTTTTTYYARLDGSCNAVEAPITVTVVPLPNVNVTQTGFNLQADEVSATYQWLTCPTMTAIIGESNQSYTAMANGHYAVIVTKNGCTDTSSCYTVISVGIIEHGFGNELSIYPNPTNGNFSIDLGDNYESVKISITDLNGRLIQSKKYANSQLLNLKIEESTGVYFLEVESDTQKVVIKLLKE